MKQEAEVVSSAFRRYWGRGETDSRWLIPLMIQSSLQLGSGFFLGGRVGTGLA